MGMALICDVEKVRRFVRQYNLQMSNKLTKPSYFSEILPICANLTENKTAITFFASQPRPSL